MAKIHKLNVYQAKDIPSLNDRLIGTSVNEQNKTKQFQLNDVLNLSPGTIGPQDNRVLSGVVNWISGLDFISADIYYVFNNQYLIAGASLFTLEDADENNDRIDVIAVNNLGSLIVIEGIPSENPQEPTIDFQTQLRVTSVYVKQGEDTPQGVSESLIYDEYLQQPSEYDVETYGDVSANLEATDAPYSNSKYIQLDGFTKISNISFTTENVLNPSQISVLSFALASYYGKNFSCYIKLANNGVSVSAITLNQGDYGFNALSSEWVVVSVPYNLLNPDNIEFNEIIFNFTNGEDSSIINTILLDKIRLVYGMEDISESPDFISLSDTPENYNNSGGFDVVVNENSTGLDFTKRRTKLSEFEDDLVKNNYLNGLNKEGNDVKLGGALIEPTDIEASGDNPFTISNSQPSIAVDLSSTEKSHVRYGDIRPYDTDDIKIKATVQLYENIEGFNQQSVILGRYNGSDGFILQHHQGAWAFAFKSQVYYVGADTTTDDNIYTIDIEYNGVTKIVDKFEINGVQYESDGDYLFGIGGSIDYDQQAFVANGIDNLETNKLAGTVRNNIRLAEIEFQIGSVHRKFNIEENQGDTLNDELSSNTAVVVSDTPTVWTTFGSSISKLIEVNESDALLHKTAEEIDEASEKHIANKEYVNFKTEKKSLKNLELVDLTNGGSLAVPTVGTFTTIDEITTFLNTQTFTVNNEKLIILRVLFTEVLNGVSYLSYAHYKFLKNDVSGVWGDLDEVSPWHVLSTNLILDSREAITPYNTPSTITIDLGDILTDDIVSYLNSNAQPTSGQNWELLDGNSYFFVYTSNGSDITDFYKTDNKPVTLGTTGDYVVESTDFQRISTDGVFDNLASEVAELENKVNNIETGETPFYIKNTTQSGAVMFPKGGYLRTATVSSTGAIKISLPEAVSDVSTNDFLSFEVTIFSFGTNESIKVLISGYNFQNFAGTEWRDCSAKIITSDASKFYTVRFGQDGVRKCVWIGETNTVWRYPQVQVSNVNSSYFTNIADYREGWIITELNTSFGSVNVTITDTAIVSAGSKTTVNTGGAVALYVRGHLCNMSAPNTNNIFDVTNIVTDGKAIILINNNTEPQVRLSTGPDVFATRIICSDFIPNENMYLKIWNNGNRTEYWFEQIAE